MEMLYLDYMAESMPIHKPTACDTRLLGQLRRCKVRAPPSFPQF